jgi:GntR family transcriptional regulator
MQHTPMGAPLQSAILSHAVVPKYHQVYLVLREQLLAGVFAAGLPSEAVLQQRFKVARVTVRKALEQLQAEGLISREAGRGTRPIQPIVATQANTESSKKLGGKLTGLLENLVMMGLRTRVKVLDVQTISATPDVSAALNLPANELVQKAVRVRSIAEGPLSLITTFVPAKIARFGKRELAQKPILVLLEESGIQVGRAEQTISAQLADVATAEHLEVAVGTALLAVKRLILDRQNKPVQWLHGLYRPDRYEYVMHLSRVGNIDAKVWVTESEAVDT